MVKVTQRDGSELYVANVGAPYPLRLITTGDEAVQADFSEYGAELGVNSPSDSVDLEKVSVAPGLAAEFKWLDAIATLRIALKDAFGKISSDIYNDEVVFLMGVLRRCARELASPGPPSQRLQPAHDLVVAACQKYEEGADCLAEALRIWDLAPENPDPGKMDPLLECGFGSEQTGGELLAQANTAGLRIVVPH